MLRRQLRRRFGISAARVAVRAQRPWYWNALILVVLLTLAWVGGKASYQFWQDVQHPDVSALRATADTQRARIIQLEQENAELRATVQAGGSHLQIERTTQDQLQKQVKALAEENARLKQDITLFESLAGGKGGESRVAVTHFSVEPLGMPGHFRYRGTVTLGGGRDGGFRGEYQLLVKLQQGGQAAIMAVPGPNEAGAEKFNLRFKQFQRFEGLLQVPDGAVVSSVELKVIADGATRATKSITL